MSKSWDMVVLGGLTALTCAVAGVMMAMGKSSWVEEFAFVTGAVGVWLTVKESAWNFPISLVNPVAFFVVFLQVRLFADMSLQVVYFVLTAVGWWLWVWGGEKHTALKVTRAKGREIAAVAVAVAVMTLAWWEILQLVQGTATFCDALTTAISLGAQWLLNYKRLQNWAFWILADLIYVPLYWWKGLYLTALLYGVFLVMAVMGYAEWWRRWRKLREAGAGEGAA